VWTIEPASYPGVTPSNARLIDGNNNPIGLGYYQTPFKLTLTRITGKKKWSNAKFFCFFLK
jgi:hypothetical protein